MTMRHYLVTLEDGQQLTIIKNMTYERWYYHRREVIAQSYAPSGSSFVAASGPR